MWLLDSGCTDHIINNINYFDKSIDLKEPVNIYLGDNRPIKATKVGSVISYFEAFGKQNEINMRKVFYAKEMSANLISLGKLTDNKNTVISKGNIAKVIDEDNKLTAVAFKENGTYRIKSILKGKKHPANSAERSGMSKKEIWHRMLGHVNFKYLEILGKEQLVTGIPNEFEKELLKCRVCIESKMHNLPFKNNRTKAREIMEIIHTDVCGPFKTTGFNGEKYFISFIDDYSKIARIYCIKSKDEVFDSFVQFVNEAENLTGKRLKILRCDNGKEYLNNRIYKFARDKGIRINNCPTYVHELNGTAERYNRTVMDMARCLLAEAKVHKRYWPEIVCTAAYLKNRILANTIERKTPFEIFFGKKPSVKNLHLYGSKVFVRRPEQKRVSKWDKKADMGILLGYSEVGYRVLLGGKITIARHVEVIETDTKCIGFEENSSEADRNDSEDNYSLVGMDKEELEGRKDENNSSIESSNTPRRSTRIKKTPVRYPEKENICEMHANYCKVDIPRTFEEAICCENNEVWKQAMDKEIECLYKNKTWKLVERVKGKEVLM